MSVIENNQTPTETPSALSMDDIKNKMSAIKSDIYELFNKLEQQNAITSDTQNTTLYAFNNNQSLITMKGGI
jgi:hypothetical protein